MVDEALIFRKLTENEWGRIFKSQIYEFLEKKSSQITNQDLTSYFVVK